MWFTGCTTNMYVNLRMLTLSHHHLLLELPTVFLLLFLFSSKFLLENTSRSDSKRKNMNILVFPLKFPIAEVQPCTNQFPTCHLSRGQWVAFLRSREDTSDQCQCWLLLYLMRLGPRQLGLYSLCLNSVKNVLYFETEGVFIKASLCSRFQLGPEISWV